MNDLNVTDTMFRLLQLKKKEPESGSCFLILNPQLPHFLPSHLSARVESHSSCRKLAYHIKNMLMSNEQSGTSTSMTIDEAPSLTEVTLETDFIVTVTFNKDN